jgi:hypothetical protein
LSIFAAAFAAVFFNTIALPVVAASLKALELLSASTELAINWKKTQDIFALR